jgi:hypothetical protein
MLIFLNLFEIWLYKISFDAKNIHENDRTCRIIKIKYFLSQHYYQKLT